MKKITLATIKSFIRKNNNKLYIRTATTFDGMIDGCRECYNNGIEKAEPTDLNNKHTLGIGGAWFVGQSRDYFTAYEADGFTGYEIYNCCGRFYLLIKKEV